MKKSPFLLSLLCAIVLASCSAPDACFVIDKDDDGIQVGKPVVFDGGCSSKSVEYVWQFQSPTDSTIYYSQTVTKTFTDTGNVLVELVVLKGNKTGSNSKTYHVNP